MKKFVAEYERLPKGYGVAYLDVPRMGKVCYLVPLHLFVRWSRLAWFAFVRVRPKRWELELLRARRFGYDAGSKRRLENMEAEMRRRERKAFGLGLDLGLKEASDRLERMLSSI